MMIFLSRSMMPEALTTSAHTSFKIVAACCALR